MDSLVSINTINRNTITTKGISQYLLSVRMKVESSWANAPTLLSWYRDRRIDGLRHR
jgi:hypothetical protein